MTVIVRALNSSGDWTYGMGRGNYISGTAAVVQDINTRLGAYLGNCFFDLVAGIDWFNLLGSAGPQAQTKLQLAISNTILNTNFVTGVQTVSINLNPITRKFSINYTVSTTFTTVSGSFALSNTTIG